VTNIEDSDEHVEGRSRLGATRGAARDASLTAHSALAVLMLTSAHHAYGAHVYQTPWRYHVLLLSIPAALVIVTSRARLRTHPENVVARWVFMLTTLVVPVLGIGLLEGLYNHVVKDALYFAGVPVVTMERLFPPPTYEMPNDGFFEVTGIMQAVVAALAARHLYRFYRFVGRRHSTHDASSAARSEDGA
jgi:hypothetical protein